MTSIEPGVVRIGSETLEAETVLWAAGASAAPIGATLGVPLDRTGRILVNPDLTIPGRDDVYVVGDMAKLDGPDGQPLPGVSQVAMQQAKRPAENIVRTCRASRGRRSCTGTSETWRRSADTAPSATSDG